MSCIWCCSHGDVENDLPSPLLCNERDSFRSGNSGKSNISSPVLSDSAYILNDKTSISLRKKLPRNHRSNRWELLYSLLRNGSDVKSFYDFTFGIKHSFIIVETSLGDKFGGFLTEEWRANPSYYGDGQSFVFSIENNEVNTYAWTYENNYIMWSTADEIGVGGGGGGFAFVLSNDFSVGHSNASATFNNPILCSSSNNNMFKVFNVEVWGFESEVKARDKNRRQKKRSLFAG